MLNSLSTEIANLAAADPQLRKAAAAEIYRYGRALAGRATAAWWRDEELERLLMGDRRTITVGVAVRREMFSRIREANGQADLASVPPDQDAEEFELGILGWRYVRRAYCRKDLAAKVRSRGFWSDLAKACSRWSFSVWMWSGLRKFCASGLE